MKRYLLFAGHLYYPSGGWDDFQGDFDSVEAAEAHIPTVQETLHSSSFWWHVVDTRTYSIVSRG